MLKTIQNFNKKTNRRLSWYVKGSENLVKDVQRIETK